MFSLTDILPHPHPDLVHFPVALLSTAVLFDILSLFFRRQIWLDRTAASLYALGSAGAIASYITGQNALDQLTDIAPEALSVASTHSDLALIVVLIFVPVALIRVGLVIQDPDRQIELAKHLRTILAIVAVAGAWFLYQTARHGGDLVFEHGAGVEKTDEPD